MTLRVARLDPRALIPSRAYAHDAGLDLHALDGAVLGPGERSSVRTGIAVEIPAGHAGLVLPRSGLAARHGIALVNAPGLIDAGYRGEVRVLMLNTDREAPFTIAPGDRIAQLVLVRVEAPLVVEVDALASSERLAGRVAVRPRICAQSSRIATTRAGAALPPTSRSGKQATVKPLGGSWSRFASRSICE